MFFAWNIPACTGKTIEVAEVVGYVSEHPRVYGENTSPVMLRGQDRLFGILPYPGYKLQCIPFLFSLRHETGGKLLVPGIAYRHQLVAFHTYGCALHFAVGAHCKPLLAITLV